MVTRAPRRLPGLRFEFQPPPPIDVLPRMDVAVFVGFAEAGPLHVPVVVEDVAQFTTIFGSDVPLAWDQQRGEQVYAYLAPVVRSFFHNGGRRCWIVRVAGEEAQYNYFPVPGLALVANDTTITPAFARARSEGSWSDELQVGTSLLSRPVFVNHVQLSQEGLLLNLSTASPNDIVVGDLLRLTFSEEGYVLMLAVQTVRFDTSLSMSSLSDGKGQAYDHTGRGILGITARKALWFSNRASSSASPTPEQAAMFTHGAERAPIPVSGYRQEDQSITLDLKIAYADAPVPGSLVRVDCTGSEQLWLTVEGVRFRHNEGSPLEDTVEITGQGLWLLRQPPTPSSLPDVEKLSFTLLAQRGNGYPVSLADLTFSVDHPRFWKALPTDEQLYREAEVTSDPEHSALWKAVAHTPYADLWIASANPRFPLAGDDAPGEIYIPLVLPATLGANPTPTYFVPYDKGVGKRLDALVRDGLQAFNASLFLDQDMVDALVPDLITQADFLRDQRVETRPIPTLRGIYTALSIEEASIIAIPDAYQRGWRLAQPDDPPSPEPSQRSHPEWWHCPADVVPGDIHTVIAEQHGKFHNAEMRVIEQPVLRLEDEPDHAGTFTLAWLSVDQDARSILEEALHSDYRDATEIYNGSEQHFTLYGRGQGYYYYRVRIEVAGAASDWSDGLVVSVAPTGRWRLNTEAEYEAHDLLAIQRALIRMCSARGDLFAVLTLPDHFHEDKAIAYIATLKALPAQIVQAGNEAGQSTGSAQGTTPPTPSSPDKRDAAYNVFPLRYDERSAFSYAALYYPWPIIRDGQQAEGRVLAAPSLKRIPPDGIICGIMAKRALIRGAWIAPANELFIDVVALTTGTGLNWQRWQTAQVNLLHQERRGFLSLNADTLCDDEDADLRPINVRRLLILLRRMALRLGATYVFELDNNSFRRLVQREFEAMMEQMFKRGAFAGNTPDTSFQVVVGQGRGVDLGRFIVELRVAPSLPLTFLTLRLVQSGTTGSVTEVL